MILINGHAVVTTGRVIEISHGDGWHTESLCHCYCCDVYAAISSFKRMDKGGAAPDGTIDGMHAEDWHGAMFGE